MQNLSAIDWQLCLKLCNNKADLAEQLLKMLIDELPEYHQKIRKAQLAQNRKRLLEIIHKLHGACCYCGVPKLKIIVGKLEDALKANQEDIQDLMRSLDHEIENVLSAYMKR